MTPTNISTATEVEKTDPAHECHLCRKQTNALSGNPSHWPVLLPYPGGNGNMREYHVGCVAKELERRSTADAERAKERERLIAEVVAGAREWEKHKNFSALEVVRLARALAAFDAANGGREG